MEPLLQNFLLLFNFQGRQGPKGDVGDPGMPGQQVSELFSYFVVYEQETEGDPYRVVLLLGPLSVHSARLKPHLEWEVCHAILRETRTLDSPR